MRGKQERGSEPECKTLEASARMENGENEQMELCDRGIKRTQVLAIK